MKRRLAAWILVCVLTLVAGAQESAAPANPNAPPQNSSSDTRGASPQDAQKKSIGGQDAPQTGSPVEGQSNSGSGSASQAPTNSGSTNPGSTSTQGKVAGTSNDRLFYTLPNFLTLENAGKLPPLSVKEKFKVVALGDFDPVQYPWWGLLSAISQAENSEPAYGQGWAAYGKRYATTAADSTIENFMVGAVFPSILRQDPRFYQSSEGGFEHRTWYAVSRIFITRSDSGNRQFNYSEVFGSALSAAISTYSYHPHSTYISTPSDPHMFVGSDRTLSNTASVWGTQVGLDTVTIVVKEFWPDVHRWLAHKRSAGEPQSEKPAVVK